MAQSVSLRKRSCSFDAIFIQVPLTHYLNKHGVERLESRCAFNIGWKANWRERKLQRWDVPATEKRWTLVTRAQKSIKTLKDWAEKKQSLQNRWFTVLPSKWPWICTKLKWEINSVHSWPRAGRFWGYLQAVCMFSTCSLIEAINVPLMWARASCDRRVIGPGWDRLRLLSSGQLTHNRWMWTQCGRYARFKSANSAVQS